jgi:uroporphyrin-III C-methyltransferase
VGVGKRAGRASPRQDHVSRLLVDYALTGARVVRLKSGDSGIFGRLEEELTALREAGIPSEIIPGVTSASAAAAAAGIPLTRRIHAQRVQFITAADTSGNLPPGLNLPALADPGATTVIYMGKRTFPALAEALIAHGLPPDTPALLAEGVSTPAQVLHRSTVADLARTLSQERSALPGLILVGNLAEGTL